MLQPRNLVRLRQCLPCVKFPVPVNKNPFSVSHRILQDPPVHRGPLFTPKPGSKHKRSSWNDSPLGTAVTEDDALYARRINVTIDNVRALEKSSLPQTGPTSGRTVSCKPGQFHVANSKLSLILKDHGLFRDLHFAKQRRLKPSDARRELRSRRHRIRFNQGIARLVGIVLRMRKKAY